MTQIYTITLSNCAFFARHGLHDAEEFLGQRFFVDAEFDVAPGQSLEADDIDGTVDYGKVFTSIEQIVTGSRRFLIETLALDIAKTLCAAYPLIRRAKITVRKPSAPIQGILDHVQVTVEHIV